MDKSPNWGGSRPGAGRPRTEILTADELLLLAQMLSNSLYAAQHRELVQKLQGMAQKASKGPARGRQNGNI